MRCSCLSRRLPVFFRPPGSFQDLSGTLFDLFKEDHALGQNRTERETSLPALANPCNTLVAAEALRNSSMSSSLPPPPEKSEEKISVFWRVFGGTLLSIAALVCITVYQGFNSSLNDLRKDINAQHEMNAEFVKKDDLNNRLNPLWSGIKDLQQSFCNSLNEVRKEINAQQEMRADLVKKDDLNNRLNLLWTGIKELQSANSTITMLKDKSALLEEKLRVSEEERKEMSRELQSLRENLAKIEGRLTSRETKPTAGN
jgi:hypothetical protein